MNRSTVKMALGTITALMIVMTLAYQNCAKSKFKDPDPLHTSIVQGLCELCEDETGKGIRCRSDQAQAFATCSYESCQPGFARMDNQCVAVICEAGAIANCTVPHGEGRKTCRPDRRGYSACVPLSCESGFELVNGACQAVAAVCPADSHRDCSTNSTYGIETCNAEGSGYGACVLGDCKAGFFKDSSGICQAQICDSDSVTPCTVGAGTGFQRCNSQGSAWGTCEINGCEAGYNLIDGVCVVQVCTPGSTTVCAFDNGTGEKTCAADGMNYGGCELLACNSGFSVESGICVQQKCTPSSQDTCTGESGTGVKYCYQNGRGHGPCQLTSCDPGFQLENGQCVRGNQCNPGEVFACSVNNGSGSRTCSNDGKMLGACVATSCSPGYSLVNQGGTPACKKDK